MVKKNPLVEASVHQISNEAKEHLTEASNLSTALASVLEDIKDLHPDDALQLVYSVLMSISRREDPNSSRRSKIQKVARDVDNLSDL